MNEILNFLNLEFLITLKRNLLYIYKFVIFQKFKNLQYIEISYILEIQNIQKFMLYFRNLETQNIQKFVIFQKFRNLDYIDIYVIFQKFRIIVIRN